MQVRRCLMGDERDDSGRSGRAFKITGCSLGVPKENRTALSEERNGAFSLFTRVELRRLELLTPTLPARSRHVRAVREGPRAAAAGLDKATADRRRPTALPSTVAVRSHQ